MASTSSAAQDQTGQSWVDSFSYIILQISFFLSILGHDGTSFKEFKEKVWKEIDEHISRGQDPTFTENCAVLFSGDKRIPEDPMDNQAKEMFDKIKGDKVGFFNSLVGYAKYNAREFRENVWKEINKNINELVFLLMIFLIPSPKEVTEELEKSLLKMKAPNKTLTVTLPRIAESFPEIVALIYRIYPNIRGVVTMDKIKEASKFPEYTSLTIRAGLACFIPKKLEGAKHILNAFMLPNMLLSEILNQRKDYWKSLELSMRYADSMKYVNNAYDSDLFNEEERMWWATQLEIVVDKKFFSVWVHAAEAAKVKLMSSYTMSF